MEGLTVGQVMQCGAWGIAIGSLFFGALGVRAERDFFLVLGLVVCVFSNFGFAVFLADQKVSGDDEDDTSIFPVKSNETAVTVYILLGCLCIYALYCQLSLYREHGCGDDEDAEEEDEDVNEPDSRLARLQHAAAESRATQQRKTLDDASPKLKKRSNAK